MDNLEKSEIVISKILSQLLEWGIQSADLQFHELELETEYQPFFFSCVEWLVDEGLIRTGKISKTMGGGGIVINPVLTTYGLSVLGRRLSNDGNDLLSDAVKEVATSKRSFSQAGDFVGGILGGLTKSLSS